MIMKMQIKRLAIISFIKRSNLENNLKDICYTMNNTIIKKVNSKFYLK